MRSKSTHILFASAGLLGLLITSCGSAEGSDPAAEPEASSTESESPDTSDSLDEVVPESPERQDGNTVIVPETDGVNYSESGEVEIPAANLTITAEPAEGFEFPEDADTRWTFVFESEPGTISGDPVDPDDYATTDANEQGEARWAFQTPTGRHNCVIRPTQPGHAVGCLMDWEDPEAIAEEAWGGPALSGELWPNLNSQGGWMSSLTGSAHDVAADTIPALDYGQVLEVEGIACTVRYTSGITCTHGDEWFELNGEGYLFSTENSPF